MGASLDGTSLGGKEPTKTSAPARPTSSKGGGALAQAKKK
jgi:hypothetical protein